MGHHRKAFARIAGGLSLLLLASGCVDPEFRTAVGSFATATQEAVERQNSEIDAIMAADHDRYRQALAEGGARLRASDSCFGQEQLSTVEALANVDCFVVDQSDASQPVLVRAVPLKNIRALSAALEAYARSLESLASDPADQQALLTEQLSGLARSAANFDASARQLVGAESRDLQARLGAVAGILAQAANLYLAGQRDQALRQTIIRADPAIQAAVGYLGTAEILVREDVLRGRRQRLSVVLDHVRAAESGDSAARRSAHVELFEAVEAIERAGRAPRLFARIGVAHGELHQAAQAGASAAQIRSALYAIIEFAASVEDSLPTVLGENGETGDVD